MESVEDDTARRVTLTCGHVMHTGCMLTAAQYDVRCPVCRQVDGSVTTRVSDEDDVAEWMHELERLSTEYSVHRRNYTAKRSRLIRKDMRLRTLHDRVKHAHEDALTFNDDLTRQWNAMQRKIWREDEQLLRIKRLRTNSLRRWHRLKKQLNEAVENNIGPEPILRIRAMGAHDA